MLKTYRIQSCLLGAVLGLADFFAVQNKEWNKCEKQEKPKKKPKTDAVFYTCEFIGNF